MAPVVTDLWVTATNAFGSHEAEATVFVGNYPVTDILGLSGKIKEGESAQLAWSCTGADEVTIEPARGSGCKRYLSGIAVQEPPPPISVTNDVGTSTADATLMVDNVHTAAYSADVTSIILGDPRPCLVNRERRYGEHRSRNRFSGTQYRRIPDRATRPATTYTILAMNAYGSASSSVTITVTEQAHADGEYLYNRIQSSIRATSY